MYDCCNVLLCNESQILVHRLPEGDRFPPKHVPVNKERCCYVYNVCISLGRPRYGWQDNIKRDLQVVGSGTWALPSWFRTGTGGRNLWMPVVLYGCETWSLISREERRLRVFENRMLSKIFGPKRDAVTGEWRKLYNEELNLLKPKDIYIYTYMSYRSANLQTLHFKYLFNKYTYWIF